MKLGASSVAALLMAMAAGCCLSTLYWNAFPSLVVEHDVEVMLHSSSSLANAGESIVKNASLLRTMDAFPTNIKLRPSSKPRRFGNDLPESRYRKLSEVPPGPYIQPESSSKIVTIPEPESPDLGPKRRELELEEEDHEAWLAATFILDHRGLSSTQEIRDCKAVCNQGKNTCLNNCDDDLLCKTTCYYDRRNCLDECERTNSCRSDCVDIKRFCKENECEYETNQRKKITCKINECHLNLDPSVQSCLEVCDGTATASDSSAAPVSAPKPPTAAPVPAPKTPTAGPTSDPTAAPTKDPTAAPTKDPTAAPTKDPTAAPTSFPTAAPTPKPSVAPIASPTVSTSEALSPTLATLGSDCPHDTDKSARKMWHDQATWPSHRIPSDGEDVTIPSGTKLVIDKTVAEKLGYITIEEDAELVIGQNSDGIELHVKGITVKGSLISGSETCPILHPVTITLHGNRPQDANVLPSPSPEIKGINVDGGTLSLHGKRYFKTWDRLAKTIEPGDTALVLQHAVNWEVGQEIVVTTSIIEDHRARHENEVLTVKSVDETPPQGAGSVVRVTTPAKYKHIANEYYQVEVGLLTRMIKIQGAEDSEPSDPDPLTCKHPRHVNERNNLYYDVSVPCFDKELTGYGGHIIVQNGGVGNVEGVELYRMGQTNVKARYPMHFHLLGDCPTCYFKHSSVHRSFYRCVAVHRTDHVEVTENVGYDVTGFCYYLEDGVEENNIIAFNLGAHIHSLGGLPESLGHFIDGYEESDKLRLPADVAAGPFYFPNLANHIYGNAASGGWSGFAMPFFAAPTSDAEFPNGPGKNIKPANRPTLRFDGNTAHSTGFWFKHASGFYIGGKLEYVGTGANAHLIYYAGRNSNAYRAYCSSTPCLNIDDAKCNTNACKPHERLAPTISNIKAFLVRGSAFNSWQGRMEVHGMEAYDSSLGAEAISGGFWFNNVFVKCRTGEDLGLRDATLLEGTGFRWYDTGQNHILTKLTFENCGYRYEEDYYGGSPTRGCDDSPQSGCKKSSTTFGFITHSDMNAPSIMQASKEINLHECGRHFAFTQNSWETVAGRVQNWYDSDGSVSGFGEPTMVGSGLKGVKGWWGVDDEVVFLPYDEGPISFIKQNNGPQRALGHIYLQFDPELHKKIGTSQCENTFRTVSEGRVNCDTLGYIRHLGHMFSPIKNPGQGRGLPVTNNPTISGPTGGFGWLLSLTGGAPRSLIIKKLQIYSHSPLFLSMVYPKGSSVTITVQRKSCNPSKTKKYPCMFVYEAVDSLEKVRKGKGNTYYMDSNGVVTFRVYQPPAIQGIGFPDFFIPTDDMVIPGGNPEYESDLMLRPYQRDGLSLPTTSSAVHFEVKADCPGTGIYCEGELYRYDPDVCPVGYTQMGYDKCCHDSDHNSCIFADGSTTGSATGS